MDEKVQDIIGALQELHDDSTTSKSVKEKVEKAISQLKSNEEKNIAIHKALNELDELAENTTMEPYTRSQIWNIVSLLESISS